MAPLFVGSVRLQPDDTVLLHPNAAAALGTPGLKADATEISPDPP